MKLPVDTKADALIGIYERAQARLESLIGAAVDRGAEGTAGFYSRQSAEVAKVLAATTKEAAPAAMQMIGDSYVQGVSVADATLGNIGKFSGVDQAAVNILADNLASKLNEASVTVGRQAEDVFRKLALENVASGIATGETRKAVSAAFRQNLVREGATAFVDKAGRRWTLQSYTAMVARTTTREAVTQGTANRMLANGEDLVTISSHEFESDICTPYDGNTFSMTGATEGYEVLDDYPPFHPNCVHVLTPASATFNDFEKALDEVDSSSSLTAEVPTSPPPIAEVPSPSAGILGDPLLGDRIAVEGTGESVTRNLADLDLLPKSVRETLASADVNFLVGDRSVSDLGDVKRWLSKSPRGWGSDRGWDEVGAVYLPSRRLVVVGDRRLAGSISAPLHESGHALDDVLGGMSQSKNFNRHFRRLRPKLGDYYKQRGEAGRSELFAEAVADVLTDEASARAKYDDKFVDYMLDLIRRAKSIRETLLEGEDFSEWE